MKTALLLTTLSFAIISVALAIKLFMTTKGIKEINAQLPQLIKGNTNMQINLSCADKDIALLANTINSQLEILREKELTYSLGDNELKNAITNIAHDIRTPLTAICGYLDMIKDGCNSQDADKYIDIMRDRASTLKSLSEELFKYSVVVDSPANLNLEKINVAMLLQETLFSFYERFSKQGITPQIFISDTALTRFVDKSALARIFSNLIDNAIKYSCGDFSIKLDNDKIEFSNKTCNLDSVSVAKLFDRFYTVQNCQSSTGLGLSIAKLLTKKLGGEIYADLKDDVLTITLKI